MLITSIEQLTPEYLNDVLRSYGVLDSGKVVGVSVTLTKKLTVSAVSRLALTYSAEAPDDAPRNLFLKMSVPANADNPQLNGGQEVEFYQKIAAQMPGSPLIRCYDAVFSPETTDYHLLLEDLSDTHFQPDTPTPPWELLSRGAVETLAKLHAFWWEDPRLGREIGNLFDQDELNAFVADVEKNVTTFTDFLGDRLSPEQHRIYERLIASRFDIWGRLTESRGMTVTHGDAHWWNFLYPLDPSRDRVRIFDWQLWHVDSGPRDLAFLLALGGFADRRPASEGPLLAHYHETLIANGVTGYSREDLWRDYRWAALRNLNIPVIFWSQGRDESLWSKKLERAMAAFEDLKCSELLGG